MSDSQTTYLRKCNIRLCSQDVENLMTQAALHWDRGNREAVRALMAAAVEVVREFGEKNFKEEV
jgi:hypothetical protein